MVMMRNDLCRRQNWGVECRMPVRNKANGESTLLCRAHKGVDAIVGLHSGNNKAFDVSIAQNTFEFGFLKGIAMTFFCNRFCR